MPSKKVTRPPRPPRRRRQRPRDPIAEALNRAADRMVGAVDQLMDQMINRFLPDPGDAQPPFPSRPPRPGQQAPPPPPPPRSRQEQSRSPNLYDVLEVSPAASPETITAAWRSLSRRFHPDNQLTGNSERMKAINAAFEVLSDPAKRRTYDRVMWR
jgi:hypothetical protein